MNAPANILAASLSHADLPSIGEAFGGGFFTAVMQMDGQNYALITAGKDGELRGEYSEEYIDIGIVSDIDGMANTLAMIEKADSELARRARAYRGGGFDDWALPALFQSCAQYRAFKPTSDENNTWLNGANPNLVPVGYRYTETFPAQTTIEAFKEGGEHAFERAWYWTSTQCSSDLAHVQYFGNGNQSSYGDKGGKYRVRPVRMIPLTD